MIYYKPVREGEKYPYICKIYFTLTLIFSKMKKMTMKKEKTETF